MWSHILFGGTIRSSVKIGGFIGSINKHMSTDDGVLVFGGDKIGFEMLCFGGEEIKIMLFGVDMKVSSVGGLSEEGVKSVKD